MSDELASTTHLESLRKEAKRWLKSVRAGDADAIARLQRAYPDCPATPGLRDVQHAIARERGFDGWRRLKTSLVARSTSGSFCAFRFDRPPPQ
jgi:hypothetical protein